MAYKDIEAGRAARRAHYYANKEQYKRRNKEQAAKMTAYIRELKESTACMDCGEFYPYYVMDFDHRDPSLKVSPVARLITSGSWTKLLTEIDKCDIVCANCHRARTWKQMSVV